MTMYLHEFAPILLQNLCKYVGENTLVKVENFGLGIFHMGKLYDDMLNYFMRKEVLKVVIIIVYVFVQ